MEKQTKYKNKKKGRQSMKARVTALLLTVAMAVCLLAGCGSQEQSGSSNTVENSQSAETSSETASASAGSEYDGDITEITRWGVTLFGQDGVSDVEAAINEISEREIGVHVNLNVLDMGSYMQQVSLMFGSGESVDLMLTIPIQTASFSYLTSVNGLMPLNDLLPEYAPETEELLGDLLKGTTVDGNIYALTTYRVLNSNCYVVMRKQVLDDLGLTEKARNMSSWTEFEEIMEEVKASGYDNGLVNCCLANSDSSGNVITVEFAYVGNDDWSQNYGFDSLGDTTKVIAVNRDTGKVEDYFESEEYYRMLKLMTDWYEKGYVYKDAATSTDAGDILLRNNVTFATVVNSESGIEADRLATLGFEVVCPMVTQEPISTSSTTKFCWAVPTTADQPEAAVQFMNLMYTNEEIANLLVWGLEGRDYVLNENGEVTVPENAVYHSADFLWGNQFLAYPAAGQGSSFRADAEKELPVVGEGEPVVTYPTFSPFA